MNKVIVAPLNWGLGHASRCIPIIKSLIEHKFTPVLTSDGQALLFLQKEFPKLEYIELPSYNIAYAKNLKWNLVLQTPKIVKTVKRERQIVENYIENNSVFGIISDNRFGVRSKKIPSVYITHQVNVLSGVSTLLTSKVHQKIIKNLMNAGFQTQKGNQIYQENYREYQIKVSILNLLVFLVVLKEKFDKENDVLIIISGPEPNRSELEEKLRSEFKNFKGNLVLVQGKVEEQQKKSKINNITIYNYLLSEELQDQINKSELIVCRSGYSSIMDLAKLSKKAFFIPTFNQPEQQYLARYLEAQKMVPFAKLNDFKLEMLNNVKDYKGLRTEGFNFDPKLFDLFKSKRKS